VKTQLHDERAIPLANRKRGDTAPPLPKGGKQIIIEVFPLCCLCVLYFLLRCCPTL